MGKALSAVIESSINFIDQNYILDEQKKKAILSVVHSARAFLRDPTLFTATTQEAENMRKWFLIKLQLALKLTNDTMENIYRVLEAFDR